MWIRHEYVGELRGDIGALWKVLTTLFQKTPIITTKKRIFQPGDEFEDTAIRPVCEIVKF
jgi:hypothetical protein